MTARKKTTGKLDFEKSLKQLEKIVQRLEDEQVPLEESLRLFEEGRKLAHACERELAAAENRVRILTELGETAPEGQDASESPDEDGEDEEQENDEQDSPGNSDPELAPGEEEFPF